MSASSVYARPRIVTRLGDCFFYHTMDVPGHGRVKGLYDLRDRVDEHLGGVDFKNKRVLEIGTADGFFCFELEKRGADVVAYDLSERDPWDVVPYARDDHEKFLNERRKGVRALNNAFWLNHRLLRSKARMSYGTIYEIPKGLGLFDVTTIGCVLLHLRDPFGALQRALRLTRETVVVTEMHRSDPALRLLGEISGPFMQFCPEPKKRALKETWWNLPPELILRFLAVLGFEKAEVSYHAAPHLKYGEKKFYTIVATRTQRLKRSVDPR